MNLYALDPATALLGFALAVALLAVLLWPRRGLVALLRRTLRTTERVRVEDAVKYLYHAGSDGIAVRPEALAGALAVGEGVSRRLLARLVALGLARVDGVGFTLTERGRTDALRLVRTHRLVEHWLATRTGVEAAEWHAVAEDAEHDLSAEEVERLAAQLGQPRYDPHGDPIPTAEGELPVDGRVLLGDLPPGTAGVVVHLEDEPREDFVALSAAGVTLGATIVVTARDATAVQLEVDGTPLSLSRTLESGVSVRRVAAPSARVLPARTLAELRIGETGRVAGIAMSCHGAQRRRLLDLGVVPGTNITAVMHSAAGDPIAYDIRGALIGLRRHQAEWILLEPAAEVAA